MMSHSGARGSPAQMKQLAAMRGLMAKPSGEIIETPIISNFKEGLTVLEYFNSTHGARKGLADTALKTANSGYLTRRLVDVAQDSSSPSDDCGSDERHPHARRSSMPARSSPRWPPASWAAPRPRTSWTGPASVIVPAGTMIEEWHIEPINAAGIQEVKIRSVLTCETANGVCGTCYGRDLARGTPVNMGEAVGVIAAQSIGEPGTQLTMRTFHIGGAAQIADQSFIESNFDGTVVMRNRNVARNSDGELIAHQPQHRGRDRGTRRQPSARCTASSTAHASRSDEGDKVKRGQRWPSGTPTPARSSPKSTASSPIEDLVEGASIVGDGRRVDRHHQARRHRLAHEPAFGGPASGHRDPGQQGQGRQAAARRRGPLPAAGRRDRRGRSGRQGPRRRHRRVVSRRKAPRRATSPAVCRVSRSCSRRAVRRRPPSSPRRPARSSSAATTRTSAASRSTPADGAEAVEYLVPKGKHIYLQDGDVVEKGDYIVDGNPAPHDILAIKGVEELAAYLVNEIQEVYRLQGVNINDKHIEVIVRQMLQKVEIDDPGDADYLANEQVDKVEMDEENVRLVADGKKPATGHPVLLGITKASLQTRSFISAASFQETTRVLTEAAVNGKVDKLGGLKENVIVGRLIPAGTGAMMTACAKSPPAATR